MDPSIFEAMQPYADFFAAIISFFKPILSPIGAFMVSWLNTIFMGLSAGNYVPYFIITGIIIFLAIIVNTKWPGLSGESFSLRKEKERLKKVGYSLADSLSSIRQKRSKSSTDATEKTKESESSVGTLGTCKECGNPLDNSKVCPFCGKVN